MAQQCCASPKRRQAHAAGDAAITHNRGPPPSDAGPEWQAAAEESDWAAVIQWCVNAGHADVDEVELGMPALDMQLGYDAPTFFDMLGFHEYEMAETDEEELESRAGACEEALQGAGVGSRDTGLVAKDCALLRLAAARLRGAEARAAYREELAEYRQDTLIAVREYYRDQLAKSGGAAAAVPTTDGTMLSASTELSHLGLLVQLVEARVELSILRDESALAGMVRAEVAGETAPAAAPAAETETASDAGAPAGRLELSSAAPSAPSSSRRRNGAGKQSAGTPPTSPREAAAAGASAGSSRRAQLTATPPRNGPTAAARAAAARGESTADGGRQRFATPPRMLRAGTPPRGGAAKKKKRKDAKASAAAAAVLRARTPPRTK